MSRQISEITLVLLECCLCSKKSWNSGNDIMNQKGTGIGKMCINFPNKFGPLKSVQAEQLMNQKRKKEFQCIMLKYYNLDLYLIVVGRKGTCSTRLLMSFKFVNRSRISDEKIVILEFKYLRSKEWQKQAVKGTRIKKSYRTY